MTEPRTRSNQELGIERRKIVIPAPTPEESAARLAALEELVNLEDYDFEAYRSCDVAVPLINEEPSRDPR
jgi:hypothetical protein